MTGPAATFGFRDVDAAEKPGLVRGVFDRVARRYDLMNDLMSGGVHRLWKDAVAARLNPQPGETIVDCAGGTGDMARRFARLARRAQLRRGGPDARIFVVDCNAEMIAAGRQKGSEPEIAWAVGDAQRLPLPDASAEGYVIAFGIRNVTDLAAALREARRVLKPGGRAVFIDVVTPGAALLDTFLQSIELLRDPSHVRNYTRAEWEQALQAAGFRLGEVTLRRLPLDFAAWVARMRTPEIHVQAIRSLQGRMSSEVTAHFDIQPDGSFTLDTMTIEAEPLTGISEA